MIMTVSCTCGAITGFEPDAQTKEVECVKCGGMLDVSKAVPLDEPPEQPLPELDLLSVE